jgi:hypothetical protein
MAWKRNILVVANVTATSSTLIEALKAQVDGRPGAFTLIVPATPGHGLSASRAKLEEALDQLRAAGIEVEGSVGDSDPLVAVTEAWDPKRYDEIIISTLPKRVSRWLKLDVVSKAKGLGLPVTHVEASENPGSA